MATGYMANGYTATWLHGYWLHGYTATRLQGYWIHGYTATRLHDYTATRLHGYTATRLHGYTATWILDTRLLATWPLATGYRATTTSLMATATGYKSQCIQTYAAVIQWIRHMGRASRHQTYMGECSCSDSLTCFRVSVPLFSDAVAYIPPAEVAAEKNLPESDEWRTAKRIVVSYHLSHHLSSHPPCKSTTDWANSY